MRRHVVMLAAILSAFLLMGCTEADPSQELANQLFSANQGFMSPELLDEVHVEVFSEEGGLYDVVIPFPVTRRVNPDGEVLDETPDEMRATMHGILVQLLGAYRDQVTPDFEEQVHVLTFDLVHPGTGEVLMEVELTPQVRSQIGDLQDTQIVTATIERLPELASRYEDRFEFRHFNEINEFYDKLRGR